VSSERPKVTAFDLSHSRISKLGEEIVLARMLKEYADRTVNKWPHLTDSKDGDDLIQVALLAVLNAVDGYRGESQFFTYEEGEAWRRRQSGSPT
jgi:DNA-directed RNA polymerase specialized sigma24 family protein